MGRRVERVDGSLRLLCMILTGVAACIFGFNEQRKEVLPSIYKTATVHDMRGLRVLMIVAAVASGYESLQLLRCFLVAKFLGTCSNKWEAWIWFVLDQGVMYTLMGATSAALQLSSFGLHGMRKLQWMKLCNMYGAFCKLNGIALFFLVLASIIMTILSTMSAHQLFSLYQKNKTSLSSSPKLKCKTSPTDQSFHSIEGSTYNIHDNELYSSS